MPLIDFQLLTNTGQNTVEVEVINLVIAGWTSRDKEGMEKHMAELEAICTLSNDR